MYQIVLDLKWTLKILKIFNVATYVQGAILVFILAYMGKLRPNFGKLTKLSHLVFQEY